MHRRTHVHAHSFTHSFACFPIRHTPNTDGHTMTHVLQCVAVCCSVLQCVAVCCSVLQCVADGHTMTHMHADAHVHAHVFGISKDENTITTMFFVYEPQHTLNRALHTLKRALHIFKRALHIQSKEPCILFGMGKGEMIQSQQFSS